MMIVFIIVMTILMMLLVAVLIRTIKLMRLFVMMNVIFVVKGNFYLTAMHLQRNRVVLMCRYGKNKKMRTGSKHPLQKQEERRESRVGLTQSSSYFLRPSTYVLFNESPIGRS